MSEIISIIHPEFLWIPQEKDIYYGGNQSWYTTTWQQRSGCGPTACAHLVWYLAQTHSEYQALCESKITCPEDFVRLMQEVWEYVTPGRLGVNSTSLFIEGALRYAYDRGITLSESTLNIPASPMTRPNIEQVIYFLKEAFKKDSPVAFLNLSNGNLDNLESWHWVTLISMDTEKYIAQILDQGKSKTVDMEQWLKTSLLGGGFVSLI